MKFLIYWNESIKMLRCPELKLLILDSIKTFGKSLILVIKYFWWLVIPEAWFYYHTYLLPPASKDCWAALFKIITNFNLVSLIVFIIIVLPYLSFIYMIYFIISLSTRPTTEVKNFVYYLEYLNRFWGYLIMSIFSCIMFLLLQHYTNLGLHTLSLILMPYFLSIDMSTYFFFDSNRKLIASILRGFSLVFYFLPICIVSKIPQIIFCILAIFFSPQNTSTKTHAAAVLYAVLILTSSLIWASISATLYAKIKDKYPKFFPTQTHFE